MLLLAVLARQEASQLHRIVADEELLTHLDNGNDDPAQPAEQDRGRRRVGEDIPFGVRDPALIQVP